MEGAKGSSAGTVVAAALAGLVAGAALVTFVQSNDAETSAPPANLRASPDVSAELQALTAEIAGVRRALERNTGAIDGRPQDTEPQQLRSEPSEAAALEALATAVQHLSARLASPSMAAVSGTQFTSTPEQRDRVVKLLDADRDARRKQHLLWSMDDVLQTYGLPDSIEGDDATERWVWGFGSADRPKYLSISFRNGHVVSVN